MMRNQYKILSEKYQKVHEQATGSAAVKGIEMLGQTLDNHFVREPVLMVIHFDSGGEFAEMEFYKKPRQLPSTAIPASLPPAPKGLWVDPKQPQPDYINTHLYIYVTTSAKELVDAFRKDQRGDIAPRINILIDKYITPVYDYLKITGNTVPEVPGANWKYEDEP